MTETPGPPLSAELNAWLAGWEQCTQAVLSQVTGQPVVFDVSADALPAAESDLSFTVVAGGAVRGEMTLRLSAATAVRVAHKFLQETEPPPEQLTAEHKDALEELLRQVAGQAATALGPTVGGEVQFHVAASGVPSWPAAAVRSLRTRDEAGTPIDIEIQISAALAAALPTSAAEAPGGATSAPAPESTAPPAAPRYERLRDVVLDVKLRFGSRRMLLRDVLALSAGVVVELDSNVSAPVDLLLDGRLVAQGHVVVVDGKYGLRITQVIDATPPPS